MAGLDSAAAPITTTTTTSSVDMFSAVPISETLHSSISSSFSMSSVSAMSSSSSSDSDSDDASSVASSSDEEDAYPPSPPIKTIALKSLSTKNRAGDMTVPSPASFSSESGDYFGAVASPTQADGTFLKSVFPRSKVRDRALPINSDSGIWNLALFDEGVDGKRVLYAKGSGGFEVMNLRENLVSLLDRADEELDCDQVVVVLEKKDKNLGSLLHSLMYVGGVVIPSTASSIHRKHSSSCVLVGIEL